MTDTTADPDPVDDTAVPLHSSPLLINTDGAGWSRPATTAWDKEATLRDLLVANPSLLPGVADPRVAAVEEFRIPGTGSVDVVAVESDGTITVCEAKLGTNADMRRTVIGQVLAYASGLLDFDLAHFDRSWKARSGRSFTDSVLGDDADETERQELCDAVAANLATGTFRIMLAVDVLSEELRSIITYLALHMDVDVVALEVAYAKSGGVEVLIPRSYGTELAATRSKRRRASTAGGRSKGHRANPSEVREALAVSAESAAPGFGTVIESVFDRLGDRISHLYSGSELMLDPVVVASGEPDRQPAKIIMSQRTVGIRVNFDWCRRLDEQRLSRALQVLEENPRTAPLVAGVREAEYRKRPLLPYVDVLEHPDALDSVIAALLLMFDSSAR